MDIGKAFILANEWTIQLRTVRLTASTFPALSQAQMTLYITDDYQSGCNAGSFIEVIRPLSWWQTNQQTHSLSVITSYLFLIFVYFYVTLAIYKNVSSLRIKYDDSKNWNSFVTITIPNVGFGSI